MSPVAAGVRQLLCGVALICSCAAAETSARDKVSRREEGREMLPGPMWFGPRLGKRTSSAYVDSKTFAILEGVLEAVDAAYGGSSGHAPPDYYDTPTVMQALHASSGKQYFTPRLGRETDSDDVRVNFVPRLGRQLAAANRAQYAEDRDSMEQRPPHFSPRLGRENTYHFSPDSAGNPRSSPPPHHSRPSRTNQLIATLQRI